MRDYSYDVLLEENEKFRTGIEEFLSVLDKDDITEEDRELARLIDYKEGGFA